MPLDRPVHAPGTVADGTTASAVALHVGLESAAHGDLVQTFTPVYRFFVLGRKKMVP